MGASPPHVRGAGYDGAVTTFLFTSRREGLSRIDADGRALGEIDTQSFVGALATRGDDLLFWEPRAARLTLQRGSEKTLEVQDRRLLDHPRNERDEQGSWRRQRKVTELVDKTPGAADALARAIVAGAADGGRRKPGARRLWLYVVLHNTAHTASDPVAFRAGILDPNGGGIRHLCYQAFERVFTEVGREDAFEALSARQAGVRIDAATFLGKLGGEGALEALEKRLGTEKATKPRDAIELAMRRLSSAAASREAAKPPAASGAPAARGGKTLRRALWRAVTAKPSNGLFRPRTSTEIAADLELGEAQVDVELRALAHALRTEAGATAKQLGISTAYRLYGRAFGWEATPERERHLFARVPEAEALEKAAAAGDAKRCEALLESIGAIAKAQGPEPALSWRDGTALTRPAQRSYVGLLLAGNGDAAALVDPLLTIESRHQLGRWSLKQRGRVPTGCAPMIDEIGTRWMAGELDHPWDMDGRRSRA